LPTGYQFRIQGGGCLLRRIAAISSGRKGPSEPERQPPLEVSTHPNKRAFQILESEMLFGQKRREQLSPDSPWFSGSSSRFILNHGESEQSVEMPSRKPTGRSPKTDVTTIPGTGVPDSPSI
jgi:hypothetical protein